MTNSCVNRPGRPDRLFCYGTLCLPVIMHRVCGLLPPVRSASLPDYGCYALVGLAYPGIVPVPGACVTGGLYTGLGRAQFARLDTYEGPQYRRLRVWVECGGGLRLQAWTYVLHPRYYHRCSRRHWSLAQFQREQLKLYLANRHHKAYE